MLTSLTPRSQSALLPPLGVADRAVEGGVRSADDEVPQEVQQAVPKGRGHKIYLEPNCCERCLVLANASQRHLTGASILNHYER